MALMAVSNDPKAVITKTIVCGLIRLKAFSTSIPLNSGIFRSVTTMSKKDASPILTASWPSVDMVTEYPSFVRTSERSSAATMSSSITSIEGEAISGKLLFVFGREKDGKDAAFVNAAFNSYIPIIAFYYLLRYRQPQSGAMAIGLGRVKRREYMLFEVLGYPAPAVGDLYHDPFACGRHSRWNAFPGGKGQGGRYSYFAAFTARVYRVVDDIEEYLLYAAALPLNRREGFL